MPSSADNNKRLSDLRQEYEAVKQEKHQTLIEGKTLDKSAIDKIKENVKAEFSVKVTKAIDVVQKFDPKRAELLATALNKLHDYQQSNPEGLTEAQQAELNGYLKTIRSEDLKRLMQGMQVLFEAGVVMKGSLEVKKEYKNDYAELSASLTALANAQANIKGDIKLFSLATLTLIDAKFEATAVAKVSVEAKAKAHVQIIDLVTVDAEATGELYAKAEATATGTIKINSDGIEIDGKIVALADAGAKVKGELAFKDKNGRNLVVLKGEASATVGAGIELEGVFKLQNGKLYIKLGAGGSLGGGAKAAGSLEIDFVGIAGVVWEGVKDFVMGLWEKIKDFFAKIFAPSAEKKVGALNNFVEQISKAAEALLGEDADEIKQLGATIGDAVGIILKKIAEEKIAEIEPIKKELNVTQNVAKRTFERFNEKVIPVYNGLSPEKQAKYQKFKENIMDAFKFLL